MMKILNQRGQSTIEFIFSFSTAFFLIIYTTKIAINYTSGYLAHYATYMASRTYLTYEGQGGAGNGLTVAKTTFDEVRIDLFNNSFDGGSDNLRENVDPNGILVGVYYDWETSFSISGMFGGNQNLEMRSESFLGREPDRATCIRQTCAAALDGAGSINCSEHAFTLGDNGC